MTRENKKMTCGILGHRDFEKDREKLNKELERLITQFNVDKFIFGSRSNFTQRCAEEVYLLKAKYTKIKIIAYLTKSEMRFIKGQENLAKITLTQNSDKVKDVEIFYDEIYRDEKFNSFRVSYIKRDRQIVEDSDIVFCYYEHDKVYKENCTNTKSGTAMAINYAIKKNKTIINFSKNI